MAVAAAAAGQDAVIADNVIDTVFDYGLRIDSRERSGRRTANVTLRNNTVAAASPAGALLRNVAAATLESNTFSGSGDGAWLAGLGEPPLCVDCFLRNNTAAGIAPPNIWAEP